MILLVILRYLLDLGLRMRRIVARFAAAFSRQGEARWAMCSPAWENFPALAFQRVDEWLAARAWGECRSTNARGGAYQTLAVPLLDALRAVLRQLGFGTTLVPAPASRAWAVRSAERPVCASLLRTARSPDGAFPGAFEPGDVAGLGSTGFGPLGLNSAGQGLNPVGTRRVGKLDHNIWF